MKDKSEKKRRSEVIGEDIARLEAQLAASKADIERAEKQKARLVQQEDELAEHFRSDLKAKARLEALEDEEGKIDREIRRYRREAEKVQKRITKLKEGLDYALRMEAADRMKERQGTVMGIMVEVWNHYLGMEKCIKSLWEITRNDWADAAVAGIHNLSSRKWTHPWHLTDIIDRLRRIADKNQPIPHGDLLKPLPELVAESQAAARNEIGAALKGSANGNDEQNEKGEKAA